MQAGGYRIARVEHGWAVRNGQGETVCPVQRSQDEAVATASRLGERRGRKTRACLRCERAFDSAGIHDRLCAPCNSVAQAISTETCAVSRAIGTKASKSAKSSV